ncbi:hypothetical protein F5141DRAFT_1129569, partial [Pisolithus sp. B1]
MFLPTDYPRLVGANRVIEVAFVGNLSEQTCLALLQLTLYKDKHAVSFPSHFRCFTILLHRCTGGTDVAIGSSSVESGTPLILCLAVDPADTFWTIVRHVQDVEKVADPSPYETIAEAL